MAGGLQKRGGYTPRRQREKRAYQAVVVGGTSGAVGVIWLLGAIVFGGSALIPILLLIVAGVCFGLFKGITS